MVSEVLIETEATYYYCKAVKIETKFQETICNVYGVEKQEEIVRMSRFSFFTETKVRHLGNEKYIRVSQKRSNEDLCGQKY